MISFIIPTLNEEKVIGKTLQCLARYSGEHEAIVSDGRSKDRTVAIAKSLGAKVIEYSGTERQTIAAARNLGAVAAKGDYFLFLDSDIFIPEPDIFLAKALACFQKDNRLVGLAVRLRVFPGLERFSDRLAFGWLNFFHRVMNNLFHSGVAPGEFQLIRANAFRQVGGYNIKLTASEDYDLFRRLRKIGKTRFEPTLMVYHTGRRAHAIGWLKLLWQWGSNYFSMLFLKKSASKEWKEIR